MKKPDSKEILQIPAHGSKAAAPLFIFRKDRRNYVSAWYDKDR